MTVSDRVACDSGPIVAILNRRDQFHFTVDRRDFLSYRPEHVPQFEIIP